MIKKENIIEFKKIEINKNNFYFIAQKNTIIFKNKISSIEINPIGLIKEKNKEYIFYSLTEEEQDINKIINAFVKKYLIN